MGLEAQYHSPSASGQEEILRVKVTAAGDHANHCSRCAAISGPAMADPGCAAAGPGEAPL